MNRQAWRDFFITVFFLGIAFIIALLSSVAAEQNNTRLAAIAAAISLLLALIGALYIIPRLARNIRLEFLRFAIRTTVTVEGLLFIVFLIVIGFAAWNTGNNLLYLVLSAMLAFLLAANLIGRISLADLSIQLRFPDHIFAGEPAAISVTLVNHKRYMPSYSLTVEALSDSAADQARKPEDDDEEDEETPASRVADGGGRGFQNGRSRAGENPAGSPPTGRRRITIAPPNALGKLAYFLLVPRQASARQRAEHTFNRRGRYPITGFRIATRFPAGFFKKWKRIEATGEILVYPKPQPISDFYHALPMLAGQIESHARGSGDDLYAIRRYHPSDHMRNIDWKATAKTLQLMVRDHMREDEWRLTIVFDTELPASLKNVSTPVEQDSEPEGASEALAAFVEKFERGILLAASLANHFIQERADVELITTGERQNVASGSGHGHLYKILNRLATLQPDRREPVDEEKRRRWFLPARTQKRIAERATEDESPRARANGGIAWRLLDEVPVLADDRRFKVLITSAAKGTIPAHVWRSAHVVFMDDL
jgi:uncharacterized protein (DUF58 family)